MVFVEGCPAGLVQCVNSQSEGEVAVEIESRIVLKLMTVGC